ncbi:hypothetical protein D3C87_1714740 [compost metagenome]
MSWLIFRNLSARVVQFSSKDALSKSILKDLRYSLKGLFKSWFSRARNPIGSLNPPAQLPVTISMFSFIRRFRSCGVKAKVWTSILASLKTVLTTSFSRKSENTPGTYAILIFNFVLDVTVLRTLALSTRCP